MWPCKGCACGYSLEYSRADTRSQYQMYGLLRSVREYIRNVPQGLTGLLVQSKDREA